MSISNDAVKALIETNIPGATATVTGDGYKYEAQVISSSFDGLRAVKRQQIVYAAVNEAITSGQLHALTIRALTPAEHAG